MLKRDSLTAQMQQLSQVLAKVKRLIIEENDREAILVTSNTILDYYGISEEGLINKTDEEFIQLLKDRAFKAEEVNMLAYFIDEYAGLQDEFISFDHISRRKLLEQQIKK